MAANGVIWPGVVAAIEESFSSAAGAALSKL